MAVLCDLSIKVAHCTQVHDMWPFGPLVSILMQISSKHTFNKLLNLCYSLFRQHVYLAKSYELNCTIFHDYNLVGTFRVVLG